MYAMETINQLLKMKANHEIEWINKVDELSNGHFAVIKWSVENIKCDALFEIG